MNAASARASITVLLLALSCGIAHAQATSAPAAQPVPAAAYGISGWQLQCSTLNKTLNCQVLDSVTARANGAVIAAVSVRMQPDDKTPTLVVQTPLGVALDVPVRVGIEGGPEQTFPFLTCINSGCFARTNLNQSFLSAMQGSTQPLRLTFSTLDNNFARQTLNVSLGLDGFAAAYAKLK